MAKEEIEDPVSFRVIVASFVTVVFAYLVYLVVDILNGWGLGWVVLGYVGAVLALTLGLTVVFSAWRWVYKSTGRYQVKQKQDSR